MTRKDSRALRVAYRSLLVFATALVVLGLAGVSLAATSYARWVWAAPWVLIAGVAAFAAAVACRWLLEDRARCRHCNGWADSHISSEPGFVCPRCGKPFNEP